MPTRLPDVLHTPADFEGSRYYVAIEKPGNIGVDEAIPSCWPIETLPTSRRMGETTEVAYEDISPLGYAEVVRAYRLLKAEDEQPTEETIAHRLHADDSLAERLTGLNERGHNFRPPRYWFNGRDNSCQLIMRTPDRAERRFFDHFTGILFRSRVGISISSGLSLDGVPEEAIGFTAQSDWHGSGTGSAAVPLVKAYFPKAKVAFERGYHRIPLTGHPKSTPPDGFGDPQARFISYSDLPDYQEEPEAWAQSLAQQARHFFEGPPYPDVATDPVFEPLLTSMQQGLEGLEQMSVAGASRSEIREACARWDAEHANELFGQRVVIYPRRGVHYRYPVHSAATDGHATPHSSFEGYIAQVSIANRGAIRLVGGLHTEAEPDYIPENNKFTDLELSSIFGMNDDREAIAYNNFEPAVTMTGPSKRRLPRPQDLLRWYEENNAEI